MSGVSISPEGDDGLPGRRLNGRLPVTGQHEPDQPGHPGQMSDGSTGDLGDEFDDPDSDHPEFALDEAPADAAGRIYPELAESRDAEADEPGGFARLGGPRRRRSLPDVHPQPQAPAAGKSRQRTLHQPQPRIAFTAQQRLLILDIWIRSGLPAGDFAPLVGLSAHTLYAWRKRFEEFGPAGLADQQRGSPTGSRINEATRRAILMLKSTHPDWGVQRIHDVLLRSDGYTASTSAIARILHEEGYVSEDIPTKPHAQPPRSFERARPNQLWQTDLFTFVLKRENRRVHLVAFMDDHSRFIVGYGLHATASSALVREVLEAAIANFGAPEEVLTDNGTQYHTWRGKSEFSKLCDRRGIRQIVATPRHPETLGKAERFWGTLWRECLESAVFQGIDDARRRIGLFVDHYNFQRPHQGIDGHVPADRFFNAAPEVARSLKARVDQNALELARHGLPRKTVYLAGKIGDVGIALHSEGEKVILTGDNGMREEVNLSAPGRRADDGQATELPVPVSTQGRPPEHPSVQAPAQSVPGTSALDQGLAQLRDILDPRAGGEA